MVQPMSILLCPPEPCFSLLGSSECKLIYYILLISFSVLHKTAKVGNFSLAQVCPKVLRQVLDEPWSKGVCTRWFYHRSLSQHLVRHRSTAMAATHSRCGVWAAVYLPFQTSQWGSLSCFKKNKSQELCSWERPRRTGGGQGELLLPFTADVHLQHLCQKKKKGIDCLNCFGKKCRELSVEICIPSGGGLHRNLRNSSWSCFLVSGAILHNVCVLLVWGSQGCHLKVWEAESLYFFLFL